MKTFNGMLSYRLWIAVPPETEATVRLVDVSRADALATVSPRRASKTEGRQAPLPFRLEYDPARTTRERAMLLAVSSARGGRILFLTRGVTACSRAVRCPTTSRPCSNIFRAMT